MWLKEVDRAVIEEFIEHSSAAMLASLPDGSILWTNKAFREFIKYTAYQLHKRDGGNPAKSWMEISLPGDDLEADVQQAQALVDGDVLEYTSRKSYLPNGGSPVPCEIYIRRYPQYGEFQCALVTVVPIVNGNRFLLAEIEKHRDTTNLVTRELQLSIEKLTKTVNESMKKPSDIQGWFLATGNLAEKNPKAAKTFLWGVFILVGGEQAWRLFTLLAGGVSKLTAGGG